MARRSAVTPEIISSRFTQVTRINPSLTVGLTGSGNWPQGGDNQADDGLGWVKISYVDRPTVLIPTEAVLGTVLYNPELPARVDSEALVAFGSGNIFLWNPGDYWIKVDADNVSVGYLQVPLDDPAMASLLAAQPGAMAVSAPAHQSVAAGATATLLSANHRRRSVVISTGIQASGACILKFSATVPSSATDGHVFLGQRSIYQMGGDDLWKGAVTFRNNHASAVMPVYVAEFE